MAVPLLRLELPARSRGSVRRSAQTDRVACLRRCRWKSLRFATAFLARLAPVGQAFVPVLPFVSRKNRTDRNVCPTFLLGPLAAARLGSSREGGLRRGRGRWRSPPDWSCGQTG